MQIKLYKYCLFLVMQRFPFVFEAACLCLQIEWISSDFSPHFTHSIYFFIISLTLEMCGSFLWWFDSISNTNIKLATQFLEILLRYANTNYHYFIYLHDEVLTLIINQSIFLAIDHATCIILGSMKSWIQIVVYNQLNFNLQWDDENVAFLWIGTMIFSSSKSRP